MPVDSPNYRFHKNPRFSANLLAEYLTTSHAGQREGVIRKAKFPRTPSVIAYGQALPAMRNFLSGNGHDASYFDALTEKLAAKAQTEIGYNMSEAIRCGQAIDAFKTMFASAKLEKMKFLPGPQDLAKTISGVRVHVRLDAPITEETKNGTMHSGGCVLLMASAPEARKDIDERLKCVAAIIHWALEGSSANISPLPRLCLSLDPFGGNATKAPTAIDKLRKTITAACKEAFSSWEAVEPPAGYDGPDWH